MKAIPIDHLVLSGFIGNSLLLIFEAQPLAALKKSGNIARQTLTVPGTSFVQSYTYDSLHRLTEAVEKTGLDFAEARYYYNNHGRFTAVDPLLASGKSANPQTFNRYAYTMNRPMILTDPTGLQAGSHSGAVYYKVLDNGAWAFSDRGGKGYETRYNGGSKDIVGVDDYNYRVTKNGWTQGGRATSGTPG